MAERGFPHLSPESPFVSLANNSSVPEKSAKGQGKRPKIILSRRFVPAGAGADADLIEMREQAGRIVIDAVCAGVLQLVGSIPAGEQTDSERAGAAGSQEVPDAVADDYGVFDGNAES